ITSVEVPMVYSDKLARCEKCEQERTFRQHRPAHLLHFVMSIITAGLWLPVWLLATVFPGSYRCRTCGSKFVKLRRPWSPFFMVFGVVVVFLFISGIFRGFVHDKHSRRAVPAIKKAADATASLPTTITAKDLQQVFRSAPQTAEMRYADAEMTVTGEAKLVVENGRQSWLVFLGNDGE